LANESSSIRALLRAGLDEIGSEAGAPEISALADLAELVATWGRRINLTGHPDAETIARRLVLDAAALREVLPRAGRIADLGSGAGFPGLPIAVLSPDAQVFLVESRERRHHFQRQVIRDLGLRNVRAIRGRFEEVDAEACGLVVAQAVARPAELVAWMLRWSQPTATLAVPIGDSPIELPFDPRLEGSRVLPYRVPLGGPERRVWLAGVSEPARSA